MINGRKNTLQSLLFIQPKKLDVYVAQTYHTVNFFGRITVVAKHFFKLTKWLHDFLLAKWRLSVQTLRIGAGVGPGCTFSSERLRACCCFALINGMGDDEMGCWVTAELVGD